MNEQRRVIRLTMPKRTWRDRLSIWWWHPWTRRAGLVLAVLAAMVAFGVIVWATGMWTGPADARR